MKDKQSLIWKIVTVIAVAFVGYILVSISPFVILLFFLVQGNSCTFSEMKIDSEYLKGVYAFENMSVGFAKISPEDTKRVTGCDHLHPAFEQRSGYFTLQPEYNFSDKHTFSLEKIVKIRQDGFSGGYTIYTFVFRDHDQQIWTIEENILRHYGNCRDALKKENAKEPIMSVAFQSGIKKPFLIEDVLPFSELYPGCK